MSMSVHGSATSDRDPTAPRTLSGAARVAVTGLVFWAAAQLAALLLERRWAALAIVQAALAEWGGGRVGITWSDPLAPLPTMRAVAIRAVRGAALGTAAATAAVVSALATHTASMVPSMPRAGLLAVGLFASSLAAVRDELLLRGFVLRTIRGLLPTWVALLACGAAAAAARVGVEDTLTPVVIVGAALRGIALAGIWVRDRGVWAAWAANTAWMWTFDSLAHGGLVDVTFSTPPDGAPSSIAVLAVAALVAFAPRRRLLGGLPCP
jgi:MYXO-CTERM domain-containing protein